MFLKKPYNESLQVTSEFGERLHPVYKVMKLHKGVDIGAVEGTKIYAPLGGKIVHGEEKDQQGNFKGYGRYVLLYSTVGDDTKVAVGSGDAQ